MADLVATTPIGENADAGTPVTWTAANNADQEYAFVRGMMLLARNTGAGAHAVTVYSKADEQHRINDVTAESIAAGATRVYGPYYSARLWRQANGKLKFKGNHAEVLTAVLLPRR